MELKNKLIKLAETCINNPSFYNNENNKLNIQIKSKHKCVKEKTGYYISNECNEDDDWREVSYKHVFDNFVDKTKINEKYFDKEYYDLVINFEDLPSLYLSRWKRTISTEILETISKGSKAIYEEKRDWLFRKQNILKVASIDGPPVDIVLVNIKRNYYYEISSGSLKAEISLDEGAALCELYVNNKEKLKKQFELNQLDERLNKYKND